MASIVVFSCFNFGRGWYCDIVLRVFSLCASVFLAFDISSVYSKTTAKLLGELERWPARKGIGQAVG